MERGELIAGRYELAKRLGRGGMGEVWAARDRTLHRDVALKLLDLSGIAHQELPQRFEREAVAAAQINHPNVVALYDRGVHEDMLFLVMEKVEGATLTEHIHAETPMSLADALELADGICAALVAAHQAHVIHYDIKPHNVMLTPDGRVKVVDFGIAGFIQSTFSVVRSSQLTPAGTPEYGAPEQFLTERGDERSDLYALGGVLFALLTGQPPFTGHNGLAVMRRKLDEEAPRLDSFRTDLPPEVTALVAELLQRDPDRRAQTAQQVHERLQRLRAVSGPDDGRTPTVRDSHPSLAAGVAFTISWTGKERLTTYADTSRKSSRVKVLARVLAVALSGVVVALADGMQHGWSQGLVIVSGVIGYIPLLALPVLVFDGAYHRKRAWSLSVGPEGITTTSAVDYSKHEYPWSQLRSRSIEDVALANGFLYRLTGLHVEYTKDAAPSATTHDPAGWPWRSPNALVGRKDGMIPICILGPMTDRQRAELAEALDRYGRQAGEA